MSENGNGWKPGGWRDSWTNAFAGSFHPLSKYLNRAERSVRDEPFVCVVTPVFDPCLLSLEKLVTDLRRQSLGNFIHVMVSNGPSPAIADYVGTVLAPDPRFIYEEIEAEVTGDREALLANLGKRRRQAIAGHQAARYVFLDADVKLLDDDYFARLYLADRFSGKDIIITGVDYYGTVLPVFPIEKGRIDMANYTFSSRVARLHPYPCDFDPAHGIANDYRFFEAIANGANTMFIDHVTARKDGNRGYTRLTDMVFERSPERRPGSRGSKEYIPVFGNRFGENAVHDVRGVLDSHLVGGAGAKVVEFERLFAQRIGFAHAVSANSATSAFWLLVKALELGENDEVIVPNIHFYGVANVLATENIPMRTCDVGPGVPNIDVESLRGHITDRTRAVVFLDYGGWPADVRGVKEYLRELGRTDIILILDAANSQFTKLDGRHVALEYDYAVYSFDMNKLLVTGEGGMVLSDDAGTTARIRRLAHHGIADSQATGWNKALGGEDVWWKVEISEPGLNLTMSNIAGVLGISQLELIDGSLKHRRKLKEHYRRGLRALADQGLLELAPCGLESDGESAGISGAPLAADGITADRVENDVFFFWIKLADEATRDALARFLLEKGIYTTVKYQPLDLNADTPNAHDFWQRSLCLPMHQNVEFIEADYILAQIHSFLEQERTKTPVPASPENERED